MSTKQDSSTVAELEMGARIVRDESGEEVTFEYIGPADTRIQEFDDIDSAWLFADLQTCVDGFREEHVGKRGVPPAVARANDSKLLMAYFVIQPAQGLEWAARYFDVSKETVRHECARVQNEAERARKGQRIGSVE